MLPPLRARDRLRPGSFYPFSHLTVMALCDENLWFHFVDNKTEASGSRSLRRSGGDILEHLPGPLHPIRLNQGFSPGRCVCICLNRGPGDRYSFSSANLSLSFLPSEAELLLPGHPPRLVVSRLPGSVVQFAGCPEGPGQGAAELRPRLLWPSSALASTGPLMRTKAQYRLGQAQCSETRKVEVAWGSW